MTRARSDVKAQPVADIGCGPPSFAASHLAVRRRPAASSISGCHPSKVVASVMSGRRLAGSSTGKGSKTTGELGAGDGEDLLGQLQHGDLSGVADVDRPGDV